MMIMIQLFVFVLLVRVITYINFVVLFWLSKIIDKDSPLNTTIKIILGNNIKEWPEV